MRRLIDWFRNLFHKHDWELVDASKVYDYRNTDIPIGTKWTYICKKCKSCKVIKNY